MGIELRPGITLPLIPLAGAIAVVVGALLPWLDVNGRTSNAFDSPFAFLWDIREPGDGLKIGIVLVVVAAAAALLSLFPLTGGLTRLLALACAVICVVFGIEVGRLLDDGGESFGDLFEYLGAGVYVSLVGSVLLALR